MKRMLTSAACAILIIGTACARKVTASPSLILHGASIIAARRIAQLDRPAREGFLPCNAMYITTTRDDGNSTTRKSEDCEE
jgi:hypothetical protein